MGKVEVRVRWGGDYIRLAAPGVYCKSEDEIGGHCSTHGRDGK